MNCYTYLIGWSNLDVWYYGVRTANLVPPEQDFWHLYKTSSNYVKQFLLEHGEPDVKKVHKKFSTKEEAQLFETKFLKRVSAKQSDRWLNRNDVNAPPTLIGEENGFYGKHHSEETRKRWSETRKGRTPSGETLAKLKGRIPPNKGKPHSIEARIKMSLAKKGKIPYNKGMPTSEETKLKISLAKKGKSTGPCSDIKKQNIAKARQGKKWYKNIEGTDCICCIPGEQPEGWIPGMIKKVKPIPPHLKRKDIL